MLTKKTKIIASISFSSLLLTGFAVFMLLFLIKQQGATLEKQLVATATVTAQEQLHRDLARVAEMSEADRAALQTYFLSESETIDFLALVEDVAKKQNTAITTDALQVVEPENQPRALEITLSLEGTKRNLLETIQIIETLPYASYVQNLNVSKVTESNQSKAALTLYVILNEAYD